MARRGRPRKLAKTMVELQVIDIFTNFPDPIVHRILKLLPLKDLSRLSCVSRRCRELCISNPYLSVSNIHYTEDSGQLDQIDNLLNRFHFNNFVGRLLTRRFCSGVKTQTFCLQWFFEEILKADDERYMVCTWLYNAINSGLQRLQLELTAKGITQSFDLPLALLSCNSLTHLNVKCYNVILKFPSSTLSAGNCAITTMLQSLILDCVRIEDEYYFGECISNFKSLKELYLKRISGTKSMSINSSTITQLRFQNCSELMEINISAENLRLLKLIWFFAGGTRRSLKISAPNLEKFYWMGHVADYNCIGDFSLLLRAEIGLLVSNQHQYQPSPMCILNKVLHSIRRVESLVLTNKFVQVKITLLSTGLIYVFCPLLFIV